MKTLDWKAFEDWVLKAFGLDKVAEDHEEDSGETWSWDSCGSRDLDFLIYGPELLSLFDLYPNYGLFVNRSRYDKDILSDQKRVIVYCGRTLLRFVPENIQDLQREAEEELGQKAKIDLKTWLEQ